MQGQAGSIQAGTVTVATSSNGGLPVEHWVERCLERIVYVSDGASPPIRDQAIAFKENIRKAVNYYMVQAAKSDRTTLHNLLINHGELKAAEIIRRL